MPAVLLFCVSTCITILTAVTGIANNRENDTAYQSDNKEAGLYSQYEDSDIYDYDMDLYNDDEIFGGEDTSYEDNLELPFQSDGSEIADVAGEQTDDILTGSSNGAAPGEGRAIPGKRSVIIDESTGDTNKPDSKPDTGSRLPVDEENGVVTASEDNDVETGYERMSRTASRGNVISHEESVRINTPE